MCVTTHAAFVKKLLPIDFLLNFYPILKINYLFITI